MNKELGDCLCRMVLEEVKENFAEGIAVQLYGRQVTAATSISLDDEVYLIGGQVDMEIIHHAITQLRD